MNSCNRVFKNPTCSKSYGEAKTSQKISTCYKMDPSLGQLIEELKPFNNDSLRYYVLTTVKVNENKLVQTGSAPNLEGGVITLCTCKHRMRTLDIKEGDWIAGLTSRDKNIIQDETAWNCLFYLIRISKLFDNQKELQLKLKKEYSNALRIKDSLRNRLGDLFFLREMHNRDIYDAKNYYEPCRNHAHSSNNKWHEDIGLYKSKKQERVHKLVLANEEYSYVWMLPKISLKMSNRNLCQGEPSTTIRDFLQTIT
jgi:hypothetical protein